MKNILVPTDFSENAENAFKYVQHLYKPFQCNFFLTHIDGQLNVQNGSFAPINKGNRTKTVKPAKEILSNLLTKTKRGNTNKDHCFYAIYEHGFFIESIKRQLEEREIDLIVMGTKGVSGPKEKVVGSNTGDVITKVQHNTLVVPNDVTLSKPREIAFPTDYNIFYSHDILSAITEMLELNKAGLRIVNVSRKGAVLSHEQKGNKAYLLDFMEESHPNNYSFHTFTNKKVKLAIQGFVEKRDVEMIIMVAKNLNFIQQLLFDSIVEKISFHSKVPFYVIHD